MRKAILPLLGAFALALAGGCASVREPASASPSTNIVVKTTCPLEKAAAAPAKTAPVREPVEEPLVVYDTPSPNHDRRTQPVRFIVLHYTATRTLGEALNTLRNPKGPARVSAHYVVDGNGDIYRLVPEERRAWHAGIACWRGVTDVNSTSIGIEIVNGGPLGENRLAPYPSAQIESVIRLCRNIQARYPIVDVVGHGDVAPGRKLDPGENFPWRRLAAAGVGVWTDSFAESDLSPAELLSAIGYDTRNYYMAVQAFRRHYYPEGLTVGGFDRTGARIAAVAAVAAEGSRFGIIRP